MLGSATGIGRHWQVSKLAQVLSPEVYLQYTSEYLKGPLYWHPDKAQLSRTWPHYRNLSHVRCVVRLRLFSLLFLRQGWLPDYPGTPMIKEGKYTSHVIGNLKAGLEYAICNRLLCGKMRHKQAFSSNELAFLSMLFFGVGLYGNLQCLSLI